MVVTFCSAVERWYYLQAAVLQPPTRLLPLRESSIDTEKAMVMEQPQQPGAACRKLAHGQRLRPDSSTQKRNSQQQRKEQQGTE